MASKIPEVLDHHEDIIELHIEKSITGGVLIFAWVLTVIALLGLVGAIFSTSPIGMLIYGILAFVGLAAIFMQTVGQIRITTRERRSANRVFGIYLGKWEPLEPYCELTILQRRISQKIQSSGNVTSTTTSNTYFDIYLLNPNHRKKWHMARFKDSELAKAARDDISRKLDMKVVAYNPEPLASRPRRR